MSFAFQQRAKELVAQMTLEEKISQICHIAPAIPRLGIPAFNWWSECCHGSAWSGDATIFPQAIGMAATFDKALIEKVGSAIGDEVRAKFNEFKGDNGDTFHFEGLSMCTPNINIFRDPRWGRGQETFGEDPYLTAKIGEAFINGLQGHGKYLKTAATLKHFAAHSGPDGQRHSFNAVVSEKDLEETYLYAFRYLIQHCDIQTVMAAYNAINGVPCCGNRQLLQDTLRGKFGFRGFVDTDDGSQRDLISGYHYCETPEEAAAFSLNAGCDLDINGLFCLLPEAVKKGYTTEERITEACERVMQTRLALGCLDDDCEYDKIAYDVVHCDKHRALNLTTAEDSIILLKNNGILPLSKTATVAVIGPNANSIQALRGNYAAVPSEYTTFYHGIRNLSEGKVYWAEGSRLVDPEIHVWGENYYRSAVMAAKRSDVVVLCLGLTPELEGETLDKKTLDFPPAQLELYRQIKEVGKPIILVSISGSCLNLADADRECDAVLQCFYPGECGGTALARVLYGEVSPSGRLPVTFYQSVDDLPDISDYSMENRTYRYYKGKPVYPFGYGLSYTTFTYSNIIESKNSVTVTVTNTGKMAGKHAVLLYGMKDVYSLVGFTKVSLASGESATVTIHTEEPATSYRLD